MLARDAALHGDDLHIVCIISITEIGWLRAGLCASQAGAQFALHARACLQGENRQAGDFRVFGQLVGGSTASRAEEAARRAPVSRLLQQMGPC